MSNWKSSYIDLDILIYGGFCTPCMFGENGYKVDQRTSCPTYTLSYSIVALSAQMLGAMMGNCIIPQDPTTMTFFASLWNNFAIGLYAGNIRTKMRNKYLLSGSNDKDTCLHFMFTSCAVCQEAQEIREQTKNEKMNHQYNVIPETQVMKK
jgi:Cys-rich protein (TIGR01571 family)